MHLDIFFADTTLHLLPEKAVWISESSTLFIADLHFGKAAHFRKAGIPIPEPIHYSDLQHINLLLDKFLPKDLYILGDLFHSEWNSQWEVLIQFLGGHTRTNFHLVKGNHDILPALAYRQSIFEIHEEPIELGNLLLTHEPEDQVPSGKLNLCGHVHPGVRLYGRGRQAINLPCFHFTENKLVLPAFGRFTGLALVKQRPQDQIFGISGEKVIKILYQE
ncbi:ligase-associated DNA damage response endonuclease PdeM [Algoriphagus sp. AGSA1]|uniref:ligase-associated DNA damage response endonuclease PdeM n=1 Tax=Algoriphagus sp. AGSA1 TaxID=2907213 RepID=UPI001F27FA80|nr:ligase-associated DNA damage response endonuclease PdeM [Algoriphagus sp. AGSA1]MCE7056734.1 ligase-associated DNA damage response endonuclease PdeM [Algoriphagus sp. AGSA1]